ncbi:hypothetical protein IC621_09005 [Bacillus sp. IB182487]|uniref:Uncharacterized protein n=2 Tax=Metabacillus arenae TaxID=2771434 RepID=A0A926NGZ2_9BACI|nr:hypothetical protein [Metabacillus arenae]
MRSDISGLKEMRSDINGLKEMQAADISELKGMRSDINEIKQGQKRLEEGQERLQKNLIDSLGAYTERIVDYVDDKTEVLNKRVFKAESEIESLSRQ